MVIKLRPGYARASEARRDSSSSSASQHKLLQYTKEHFRHDVSNVLVNRMCEDECLVSDFLAIFENVVKRDFPQPQDFEFTKQQELFDVLGDMCKLERKGNQVYVRKILTQNCPHSQRKRSACSSSSASVQEIRSPHRGTSSIPILFDTKDPFTPMPHPVQSDLKQRMSQPFAAETWQQVPPPLLSNPRPQMPQHMNAPHSRQQPFMMTVKDYPYAHKVLKATDRIKDIVGPLQFSQISEALREVPLDQLCSMIDDFSFRRGTHLMEFVNHHSPR